MNQHDRENLKFIRLMHDKGADALDNFLSDLTPDDMAYAVELLAMWERELTSESEEFEVEQQIEVLGDYPEANTVLKKFRLTH